MKGKKMMQELFNDCQLTALDCTASMAERMSKGSGGGVWYHTNMIA